MTQKPAEPKSGEKMPDGTVYVDTSPTTHNPLFTTPEDIGEVDISDSEKCIRKLNERNAYGHNDWRLANKSELEILLRAKKEGALRGTFNDIGMRVSSDFKLRYLFHMLPQHIPESETPLKAHYLSSEDLMNKGEYIRLEVQHRYLVNFDKNSLVTVCVRPVRSEP